MLQELVEFVVKQCVNNPQDVSVTVDSSSSGTAIEISVNDADRGKVIGREGQTIKAIRTLVNAATPDDTKVSVDLAQLADDKK